MPAENSNLLNVDSLLDVFWLRLSLRQAGLSIQI